MMAAGSAAAQQVAHAPKVTFRVQTAGTQQERARRTPVSIAPDTPVQARQPRQAGAGTDIDAACTDSDRDATNKTITLTGPCTTTQTLTVPEGYTLDGDGNTITAHDPSGGFFEGPVLTNAGTSMFLRNLTVEGTAFAENCATNLGGVKFTNAGGSMTNVHVLGITQHSGCQLGHAIWIEAAAANGHQTVTITGCTASGFQKTGLLASGDATVDASHNTFGPPDFLPGVIASNSVQYGRTAFPGAGSTFTDNKVLGATFGEESVASTAMIVFRAANLTIRDNTFGGAGTDIGLYIAESTGITVEGNRFERSATPPGLGDYFGIGIELFGATDVEITGNTLTGNGYGVYSDQSSGVTVSGNDIADNRTGLWLGSSASEVSRNAPGSNYSARNQPNVVIVGNTFTGNTSAGITLAGAANVTIENNTISAPDTGATGINLTGGNSNVTITGNGLTNLGTGISVSTPSGDQPNSGIAVNGNSVTNNGTGIAVAEGGLPGGETINATGNYWSGNDENLSPGAPVDDSNPLPVPPGTETHTSLEVLPTVQKAGREVALIAHVSGCDAGPASSGTLTFAVNGVPFATPGNPVTLDNTRTAELVTRDLPAGLLTIRADYGGNTTCTGSTSDPVRVLITTKPGPPTPPGPPNIHVHVKVVIAPHIHIVVAPHLHIMVAPRAKVVVPTVPTVPSTRKVPVTG